MNTVLQYLVQVHWLRFFLSAVAILVIWRLRTTGAGSALVDALNNVHVNVWAILLIGWGVLLTIHGKDGVGQVLITGGFALLRGPTTKPTNGGTTNGTTTTTTVPPSSSTTGLTVPVTTAGPASSTNP